MTNSKNKFSKYLKKESGNFLNIGCNVITPESWINIDGSWSAWFAKYPCLRSMLRKFKVIDRETAQPIWPKNIIVHDVNGGIPFPDATIAGIYASHVLEHLSRSRARFFLQESYRVLKPGRGIIRLVVPNLEDFIREYIELKEKGTKNPNPEPANHLMERLGVCNDYASFSWCLRIYRSLKDFLTHKWMYDPDSLIHLVEESGFERVSQRGFLDSGIPVISEVEKKDRFEMAICVEGYKSRNDQRYLFEKG